MVPWASVDAVPGESVGRAIVATLDNVATKWGVSSERGGAVSGAAKSVSVEAISAYEAMALTMQQSRDRVAVEGQYSQRCSRHCIRKWCRTSLQFIQYGNGSFEHNTERRSCSFN